LSWHKHTFEILTHGKGLYPFTDEVEELIAGWKVRDGMCFLYVQHTSASLTVSENYDPTARVDMEQFLEKIAPEGEDWHQHTLEGSDDSSAHLRALVTPVSLTIPIDDGRLSLGTWQGLFLIEHRMHAQRRRVLVRVMGV
jgi:secondary thiamine-phosphate synthase enzyme